MQMIIRNSRESGTGFSACEVSLLKFIVDSDLDENRQPTGIKSEVQCKEPWTNLLSAYV